MFKLFLLVGLLSGQPIGVASVDKSYDSEEACTADMPAKVTLVQADLDQKYGLRQLLVLDGVCKPVGDPA